MNLHFILGVQCLCDYRI